MFNLARILTILSLITLTACLDSGGGSSPSARVQPATPAEGSIQFPDADEISETDELPIIITEEAPVVEPTPNPPTRNPVYVAIDADLVGTYYRVVNGSFDYTQHITFGSDGTVDSTSKQDYQYKTQYSVKTCSWGASSYETVGTNGNAAIVQVVLSRVAYAPTNVTFDCVKHIQGQNTRTIGVHAQPEPGCISLDQINGTFCKE